MRLYVAQAAFDLALSRPPTLSKETTRSVRAELTACRALALVGTGRLEQSRALAIEALQSCGSRRESTPMRLRRSQPCVQMSMTKP